MRLWPLIGIAFVSAAHAQYAGATTVSPQWKTGFDAITIDKAKDMIGHLAGPGFRGRNPIGGDFNLAAGWLAERLEKLGVKPAGDDGTYFHRFVMWDTTPIPSKCALRSSDGALNIPFGSAFSFMSMIRDSWKTPKIAFISGNLVGSLTESQKESLTGRWVFISSNVAMNENFRKELGAIRSSLKGAYSANGRGPNEAVSPRKTTSIKGFPDPRRESIFALSFSAETMNKLAQRAKATQFLSSSSEKFTIETSEESFIIDSEVAAVEYPMLNVVGKIEGTDTKLKNEAIMIGSHLDHLGEAAGGATYYGADDNASGCTANYLIADAISKNATKPKRSVYFCFWSSEELGLLGSYAYVQRPTIPLSDIAAYINMDMVGRNENDPRFKETAEMNTKSVYPSGVAFNSPEFLKVLFDQNAFVGLKLKPDVEDRIMRSDSGSFAWKEIPTVKVFTGDHEDYHRTTDTPEKINYEKLTNIAKWLYLTVQNLAGDRPRPKWVPTPFKPKPWD